LNQLGINDYEALVTRLSDNQGRMTNVARYANGHLFNLYEERTALEEQIAVKLGGVT